MNFRNFFSQISIDGKSKCIGILDTDFQLLWNAFRHLTQWTQPPQKISILMAIFGLTWTWKDTWMGHKSVPSIYFHCLGCVLEHFPVPRYIFLLNMASCHFGCFLPPKPPIFGPTWTWNGTWMGRKSVQHMYSHYLGCVLVHFHVSRWVIELIWQPTIMVYFDPKNGHFWTPPDLEWDLERG